MASGMSMQVRSSGREKLRFLSFSTPLLSRVRGNNFGGNLSFSSRRAFTLIEILFAMSILAMMGTMLYNALFTAMRGVKAVDKAFVTPRKALILSRMFERELTGVYLPEIVVPPVKKDKNGKVIPHKTLKEKMEFGLVGKSREIHFTTMIPLREGAQVLSKEDKEKGRPPLGDILEIGYSYDSADDFLTKRRDPVPDDDIDKGGDEIEMKGILLDEVKFEYYDKKWQESWDSRKSKKLPRAVRANFLIRLNDKQLEGMEEEEAKRLSFKHQITVLLPNAVDNKSKF